MIFYCAYSLKGISAYSTQKLNWNAKIAFFSNETLYVKNICKCLITKIIYLIFVWQMIFLIWFLEKKMMKNLFFYDTFAQSGNKQRAIFTDVNNK